MKADKTVYLVRHGQSVDNTRPVFQSVKSPLSSKGQEQAGKLAERLRHVQFDLLVSSPVERANQTAEIISDATKHNIKTSDLFVERIKPTSTDGKPYTDSVANKLFGEWEKSLFDKSMRVEDGENYLDITTRAQKALDYLLEQKEENIVVVTHGFILRTILAKVLLDDGLNEDLLYKLNTRMSNENTGITVLKYADAYKEPKRWRIWTLNDHAHFAE